MPKFQSKAVIFYLDDDGTAQVGAISTQVKAGTCLAATPAIRAGGPACGPPSTKIFVTTWILAAHEEHPEWGQTLEEYQEKLDDLLDHSANPFDKKNVRALRATFQTGLRALEEQGRSLADSGESGVDVPASS